MDSCAKLAAEIGNNEEAKEMEFKHMQVVLYIHGKGGSATESEHWFHTEDQMLFLDKWIKQSR